MGVTNKFLRARPVWSLLIGLVIFYLIHCAQGTKVSGVKHKNGTSLRIPKPFRDATVWPPGKIEKRQTTAAADRNTLQIILNGLTVLGLGCLWIKEVSGALQYLGLSQPILFPVFFPPLAFIVAIVVLVPDIAQILDDLFVQNSNLFS